MIFLCSQNKAASPGTHSRGSLRRSNMERSEKEIRPSPFLGEKVAEGRMRGLAAALPGLASWTSPRRPSLRFAERVASRSGSRESRVPLREVAQRIGITDSSCGSSQAVRFVRCSLLELWYFRGRSAFAVLLRVAGDSQRASTFGVWTRIR